MYYIDSREIISSLVTSLMDVYKRHAGVYHGGFSE